MFRMDLLKTLLAYMATTLLVAVESTSTPAMTPTPTPAPTPDAAVVETVTVVPSLAEETPVPTVSVTPVPVPTITPNMKGYHNLAQGARGDDVKKLQERLIELGYLPEGSADGAYGGQTRNAVRRFQYYNGLTVDGVAGRATQTNLFENPDAAPYPTAAPEAEPEETDEAEPAAEAEETDEAKPAAEADETDEAVPAADADETDEAKPAADADETDKAEPAAEVEETDEAEPAAEAVKTDDAEPAAETEVTEPAEETDEAEPAAEAEETDEAEPAAETEEKEPAAEETDEAEPAAETEVTEPAEETDEAEPAAEAEETDEEEPAADVTEEPLEEVDLDEEESTPVPPSTVPEPAYEDLAGWIVLNESGAPMQWTELVDGVPVVRSPRMQRAEEDIRVSLDDLCKSIAGWVLTEEEQSLVLEAQGFTLAMLSEDAGLASMVDGLEMVTEAYDFSFSEGHFIRVDFLTRALDGSWAWDQEEETLMIRIPEKDASYSD